MAVYTDKSEQELVNEMAGYGQHQYSLQEALGVYTGIDPYRFQPVELLNYRNGTSYATFQEALFNNLKTTLGLTGTHGSNLFSAQELLFKAQEAGIGLNEVVNSYLLFDKFTTAVAAGSVNNTSAEPVGGVRTVTDTNSKISIASGKLDLAAGAANNDAIWWPSIARANGRTLLFEITPADTAGASQVGFDNNQSGGVTDVLRFLGSGSLAVIANGTGSVVIGVYTATAYQICIIMRSNGTFYFIKGGDFTKWTLLWHYNAGNSALFPVLQAANGTAVFTADNVRIPDKLFLPTPLAYDTFTRSNGALGSTESTGPDSQSTPQLGWTGSTFAISSNAAVGTPVTLGSELLTDGGLEDWASATNLTSWSEAVAGTSTVNQETVGVHGGSDAVRFDIDASNSIASINQVPTIPAGTWIKMVVWVKASATGKTGVIGTTMHNNGVDFNPGTTWTQYVNTDKASTNPTITLKRSAATSGSVYFDDFSIKALTLSELFSSISTSTKDVIADVNITQAGVRGIQAGLVINLDSASNPQNFVIAYLDGYGNAVLEKCVAGTYTGVISAAVTYSAGATLRVIKSGTSYQLFYNNAKVGSTSTISDAGIVDNTIHGLFSTYEGNTFDNFLLFPRGTSNEYATLDSF